MLIDQYYYSLTTDNCPKGFILIFVETDCLSISITDNNFNDEAAKFLAIGIEVSTINQLLLDIGLEARWTTHELDVKVHNQ